MIDVKKLIAVFLILAAGASSSVLIFSYLNNQKMAAGVHAGLAVDSSLSPLGSNAFAPRPEDNADNGPSPEITNSPNNLMGTVTGAVLAGVIAANPEGPATDANGNQTMKSPDQAKILAALANDATIKNFKIPDWEAEAAAQKLNIVKNSTSATIAYLQSFNDIFQKDIAQNNIESITNKNADVSDPDILAVTAPAIKSAFDEAVQIPTPQNLVGLQKSFVKLLAYQKNIVQITAASANDPIQSSLILEGENSKYQAAVAQFKSEVQKNPFRDLALQSNSNNGLSFEDVPNDGKQTGPLAFFDAALGIPTAHAVLALLPSQIVHIIATWAGTAATWETIANQLWEFMKSLALQMVKNIAIHYIQNKVLAWVKGTGQPKFVQQWAKTLVNVGIASANAKLNNITPLICNGYGPAISAALRMDVNIGVNGGAIRNCPAGTVDATQINLSQPGGWDSYYSMLQPQMNFNTQLMSAQDAMNAAQGTAQTASAEKTAAAQGFKGDQKCEDGSNPNGTSSMCMNLSTGEMYPEAGLGCTSGDEAFIQTNGGLCANGKEPTVTTPGQITVGVALKAFGTGPDLVVNANNLTGIVVAMAESLMSSIATKAVASANQSIDEEANAGLYSSAISTAMSSTPPNPAMPSVSCSPNPTTQISGSPAMLMARGGPFDANGNPPVYKWTAPEATFPATGPYGDLFPGVYTAVGTYNVIVSPSTAPGTSATCVVNVTTPGAGSGGSSTSSTLACSPATQTVSAGAASQFTVTATGGTPDPVTGQLQYSWTAAGATPSTGATSSTFSGSYSTPGSYSAIVTDPIDGSTATCAITVTH